MVIPSETDVVVIGGGPAGLAAALAARQNGLEVCILDRAEPPIDKACGEGLMPDGVAALRGLGVVFDVGQGRPFRGIQFIDEHQLAQASFPAGAGIGIRRTALHQILVDHAQATGVVTGWRATVTGLDPEGVKLGDRSVRCRWIIGADGALSQVRQWAGLAPLDNGRRRVGLRQHFRVKPWSDFVEVHWAKGCQAYVTPVGPDEICIALLDTAQKLGFADLAARFPKLSRHLEGAESIGVVRGGLSASRRLRQVTRGRIALVGDASSSIDAITGDGLTLAFRQATALGAALAKGDLASYDAAHRRICRMPFLMARLLLLMDGREGLREVALQALAARPDSFSRLLATHVGARHPSAAALDVLALALRVAAGAARPRNAAVAR